MLRAQVHLFGILTSFVVVGGCSDGAPTDPPRPDAGGVATDAAPADGAPSPLPDAGAQPDLQITTDNATCAKPWPLTLGASGKVSVKGDTLNADNEFYDSITCASMMGPFKGSQLYYRVALKGGQTYKLVLEPDKLDLALYAFEAGTSCDAAAINAACAAHWRDTPDITPFAGNTEELLLTPKTDGDWILVADSYDTLQKGQFTLTVEVFSKPTNASCAAAETVALPKGQPVTVTADTIGAADELFGLTCGEQPAAGAKPTPFVGPQLYYKLALQGGTKYRFNLKPEFSARLYLFDAAAGCAAAAIESACASAGASGDVVKVSMGGSADLYFTPASSGSYLLAVDSTSPMLYGRFTLTVAEHTTPGFTAPFALDFEGGCQGLAATGDWECGKLAFKAGANCKLGSKTFGVAPTKAHSGAAVWGTVLNDCYNPLGNSSKVDDKQGICTNLNLADDSVLKLKVTLPASWTTATLSYWSWEDLNSPFDWAEIRVNNKVAYQHCEPSYLQPTAWKERKLDLSAHVGQSVELAFHFMASSYVNYAGWYIDDLSVSGK